MLKRLLLNDRFILVLIIINAATIFLQGFEFSFTGALENADHLLTLIFLLEAIAKITTLSARAYFRDTWNLFDLTLVLLALPSLAVWAFGVDLVALNFLMVFRILRVFKFFRVLRFIPNIEHLLLGVTRAIRSSILIVFAFFIFNFILAILSFTFYRHIAPEYFSNPLLAFYSTFKVFTIEGWYEIPDLIAERSSAPMAFFARLYFVALLFGGGIFGLSLINSIFVDNMLADNTEELEKQIARVEEKLDELLKRGN